MSAVTEQASQAFVHVQEPLIAQARDGQGERAGSKRFGETFLRAAHLFFALFALGNVCDGANGSDDFAVRSAIRRGVNLRPEPRAVFSFENQLIAFGCSGSAALIFALNFVPGRGGHDQFIRAAPDHFFQNIPAKLGHPAVGVEDDIFEVGDEKAFADVFHHGAEARFRKAQFFLRALAFRGFLNAGQRAGGVVGQSLKSLQVFRRVGMDRVALNRKDAHGPFPVANRHEHQRRGAQRRVANRPQLRFRVRPSSAQDQLRAVTQHPPADRRGFHADQGRGHFRLPPVDDVQGDDWNHLVGGRRIQVKKSSVPPEQILGGVKDDSSGFDRRGGGGKLLGQVGEDSQAHFRLLAFRDVPVIHHHGVNAWLGEQIRHPGLNPDPVTVFVLPAELHGDRGAGAVQQGHQLVRQRGGIGFVNVAENVLPHDFGRRVAEHPGDGRAGVKHGSPRIE